VTLSRIFAAVAHAFDMLKEYHRCLKMNPGPPNVNRLFPIPPTSTRKRYQQSHADSITRDARRTTINVRFLRRHIMTAQSSSSSAKHTTEMPIASSPMLATRCIHVLVLIGHFLWHWHTRVMCCPFVTPPRQLGGRSHRASVSERWWRCWVREGTRRMTRWMACFDLSLFRSFMSNIYTNPLG
jgi:hypothetical protein